MRLGLVIFSSSVLLLVAANAHGQAWPDRLEPGINFYEINSNTIRWVRAHKLQNLKIVGKCASNGFRIDTSLKTFELTGDSTIVKDGPNLEGYRWLDIFDGN